MTAPSIYLIAEQPFQAARDWPLGRMHGHGFLARAVIEQRHYPAAFSGAEPEGLETTLQRAVQPLDYALVNDRISEPGDEAIAAWLLQRLPGDCRGLWLQSAPGRGVTLTAEERVGWARFRFEAAHRLPNVPADHKCGRMHGHGFEVVIEAGEASADALASAWNPLHTQLHLTCLNDLPGLENPTSEVLAAWLFERLADPLPQLKAVTVMETASAGCRFDGHGWRIWKSQSFDSAVRLNHAPGGDRRGRVHGHTFATRLHLTGELDAVFGWVEDYGDVKRRFDPVFRALDHRPLHEDDSLTDNDPASIARRIDSDMAGRLPGLSRVDVLETPRRGALLMRVREDGFGLLQP